MLFFGLLCLPAICWSQDPNFSQFFSSPLNINPGLTGHINSDWRMISNFRNQWIGPASPYVTGTISYDRKMFQRKSMGVSEKNTFGIGSMLMFDHAMSGIVKSTYASLNLSYRIRLYENDKVMHRLGAGFGTIYGQRFVDFSRLDFEEQFTGRGFNTNLPTGEVALSNMKPYFSATLGLIYNIASEKSNFDIGVASFHLNTPRQTFLEDPNQELARRNVVHANYETYLNPAVVLNTNAVYQFQSEAQYYSFGGALGYLLSGADNMMVNGGLWYWSANAITPYIGLAYKDLQFGFSYDITISKLRNAPRQPNTFEFSLILRGQKEPAPGIPCPWR